MLPLWFLLSFFFFPDLRLAVADWMSTILPRTTMMWSYCEFRMQVWNVLQVARWNTGCKVLPSAHHRTSFRAISSQLRHISAIGKKVKQQSLLNMSSQYGDLRPTNGWDRLASLGHPSIFHRVSRLGFITAPTSLNGCQPNFAAWYLHATGRPSRSTLGGRTQRTV